MNTKKMGENLRIKPAIEAMEVGEKISFPLEKLCSVRTTATTVGLVKGRNYSANINKTDRVVVVSRNL